MKRQYPNVSKVELIARALGELREQLVFVGGCAVDFLLTDAAAASSRVTYDVDLVAQVTALSGYHRLEEAFARLGFKRDVSKDAPICRWRFGNLEVDLMPADTRILGFANRWYLKRGKSGVMKRALQSVPSCSRTGMRQTKQAAASTTQ